MKYPNLELVEKTFKEKAKERYPEIFETAAWKLYSCEADMFSQTWSDTATGFDLEGGCSGQAFTNEYTTVMTLTWLELSSVDNKLHPKSLYGVFFGNRLAYILKNPNQKFEFDFRDRCMNSQKNARLYIDDEFREYRDLSFS